jgi:hypothetical protein
MAATVSEALGEFEKWRRHESASTTIGDDQARFLIMTRDVPKVHWSER